MPRGTRRVSASGAVDCAARRQLYIIHRGELFGAPAPDGRGAGNINTRRPAAAPRSSAVWRVSLFLRAGGTGGGPVGWGGVPQSRRALSLSRVALSPCLAIVPEKRMYRTVKCLGTNKAAAA